jgi:hypothetical protein
MISGGIDYLLKTISAALLAADWWPKQGSAACNKKER